MRLHRQPHERWTSRTNYADRFTVSDTVFVALVFLALLLIEAWRV